MNEPLILKKKDEPTVFNKEMAIGTLIAPGVGTVVGGYIGKNRMEKEAIEGKIVSTPSALNKDTLLGGLLGSTIGSFAALALAGGALFTSALPIGIILAGSGIGALAGAVIGGNSGKAREEREYAEALQQRSQQQATSKSPAIVFDNEIAPGKSHAAEILAERARAAGKAKEI